MKNNSGKTKVVLVFVIIVIAAVAIFYYFINRPKSDENMTVLSKTQAVVQRDLSIEYPKSPRAVVKYYAELSQCMYDTGNTEKDISDLAVQSRKLLDDELVAQQTSDQYLADLKSTIKKFADEKRRIVSFTISSTTDVDYATVDDGELASLYCIYTLQKGTLNYSDKEQYILRKDSEGHWKILGWQSAGGNQGT
ncbi:hypothetical protein SAMN05216390_11193 [Lachnospiraceae bacterium KH1T2]|nr:hypothetical protein SAMN05216390_11193 [Lachnospiraceae bacterium KH1T2]